MKKVFFSSADLSYNEEIIENPDKTNPFYDKTKIINKVQLKNSAIVCIAIHGEKHHSIHAIS